MFGVRCSGKVYLINNNMCFIKIRARFNSGFEDLSKLQIPNLDFINLAAISILLEYALKWSCLWLMYLRSNFLSCVISSAHPREILGGMVAGFMQRIDNMREE